MLKLDELDEWEVEMVVLRAGCEWRRLSIEL